MERYTIEMINLKDPKYVEVCVKEYYKKTFEKVVNLEKERKQIEM